MIIDLNERDLDESQTYDVVVIGAGAVGTILSVYLSNHGHKVAVLESGGGTFETRSQDLNLYSLSGRHHLGISEGRARVVGGTSTLWGGQIVPFTDMDFVPRDWVESSGWPITKHDVNPYYEKVERLLGLDTDFTERKIWEQLDMMPPNFGESFEVFLTRWLKETNVFTIFKDSFKENKNLTLIKHAIAKKIACKKNNMMNVEKVFINNNKGKMFSIKSKYTVVANGTIEASRLMLYSAHLDEGVPWSKNKNVGKYFQDHIDLVSAKILPIDKERFSKFFDNIFIKGMKYQPKIRSSYKFQNENQLMNISSSFIFDSSISEQIANTKIFLRSLKRGAIPENWKEIPGQFKTLSKVFLPLAVRYIRDRRILNFSDKGIYLNVHCEQKPIYDSSLTLDFSKEDSIGMPAINLNWKVDGSEIDSINAFCIELDKAFTEQRMATLDIKDGVMNKDKNFLLDGRDSNHQCGGLIMSSSSDCGVVDKDLKVFGTNNLFVAGAAVYPTSSYANSTFTAMALSLKAADNILDGLKNAK